MYQLTLSLDERKAMDWIGDRYFHGYELFRILWCDCEAEDENIDWSDEQDITFIVPEHLAWEINEELEKEDKQLACISEEFKEKLLTFCDSIV